MYRLTAKSRLKTPRLFQLCRITLQLMTGNLGTVNDGTTRWIKWWRTDWNCGTTDWSRCRVCGHMWLRSISILRSGLDLTFRCTVQKKHACFVAHLGQWRSGLSWINHQRSFAKSRRGHERGPGCRLPPRLIGQFAGSELAAFLRGA